MDVGADVETGIATEQTSLKLKHNTFADALGASIMHCQKQLQSVSVKGITRNVLNASVKETMLVEARKEQITATQRKRNSGQRTFIVRSSYGH